MIYKRINDINTLASTLDNETYLAGTDEYGNEITIRHEVGRDVGHDIGHEFGHEIG